MIERLAHLERLHGLLQRHPVVAILGTRQVGKTTLARQYLARHPGPSSVFDLEDPADLGRLRNPMLALRDLTGLVVIDEIQRQPDLFPILRVLADRPDCPARFLVLGSAGPDLLRQTSESLAGRIFYHELEGLTIPEVGTAAIDRLWLRGGLPRSFLAVSDETSMEWRRGFVRTFLERDLAQLGIRTPAPTLRRFWTMVAHYHGQTWNASEFARAFGVADSTVGRYLDVLVAALVVRRLQPWHESLQKRQVRSPKVYIADSGILHTLLNLGTQPDLESHPKIGASWEGFCLTEITSQLGAYPEECFFWATHSGAELDLLVVRGRRRLGFELKRTDSPRATRSMHSALEDLKLERLYVVHAGQHSFPLTEDIQTVAISRLQEDLPRLT